MEGGRGEEEEEEEGYGIIPFVVRYHCFVCLLAQLIVMVS